MKMKKSLSFLLTAAMMISLVIQPFNLEVAAETGQTIFINEVMASNTNTIRDGDVDDPKNGKDGGAYSDWIEIYNSGTEPVDLTGYILSDSSADWKFPKGTVPAKGHLIVWASDKNKIAKDGQLHANFKISASGENITLKRPDGTIIDSVDIVALDDDQSYGRKYDGDPTWVIFSKSTPNKPNIYSSSLEVIKEPLFSHSGGFYDKAFDLKLSTEQEGVKIYYTMDGSDPVPGAEGTYLYENGITIKSRVGEPNVLSMISNISSHSNHPFIEPKGEVFKCTTIKAVSIRDGGGKSGIITHSYFVDPNMKDRYNLPVISLVTDKNNLFDDTIGIYVNDNYLKKGDDWERPVHIEFFEKDGTLAFSHNSGIRINGGLTRRFPQKSLRLYADHGYDETNKFKYEIFPGLVKKANNKKLDSFKRIILRNAGNDSGSDGVWFRDAVMQSLVSHLSLDTQAYRPSVVFLDGEFWGIYNVRERYDNEYFASHYNLDKDKVVMLDVLENPSVVEGVKEDKKAYTEDVIDYLKSHSILDQDTYDYIKTKIDIRNYIEYNVAEMFFGNFDWPANNTSIWRYKTDDGKYHPDAPYGQDGRWRWVLRDLDCGFGLFQKSVTFDTLNFATTDEPGQEKYVYANQLWATFLLKTLLQNPEFRNEFINCFADQLNTSFIPERVNQRIDEYAAAIEKAMPENINRWNTFDMETWYKNLKDIKTYADKRPFYVRNHIINKFKDNGVTGTSEIKLETDPTAGYVRVNSIDIKSTTPGVTNPSNWSGIYFKGVPITLKAFPAEGYKFDHWEGVTGVESNSDTITFIPSENMNIKAVFRPEITTPAPFSVRGYLDSVKSNTTISGFHNVRGWFYNSTGVKKVDILVDDKVVGTAQYGLSRPDVPLVFPEVGMDSGFSYMLDTTKLSEGNHTIEARGIGNNGAETTIRKVSVMVSSKIIKGHFDSPKSNAEISGKTNLSGWFYNSDGVERVEVLVDGVFNGVAEYGRSRPDVPLVHPYIDDNSGYRYSLDTTKLSPGVHAITVCGVGKDGSRTNYSRQVVVK